MNNKKVMKTRLEQIKKTWVCNQQKGADVHAWDSVSKEYARRELPDFNTDGFLKFMADNIEITRDMTALDVGCGAGTYSLALSAKVKSASGIDFSLEMIKCADRLAQESNIKNVDFSCVNWLEADISDYRNKYDIVFAHTTPAIADYSTFKKMIDCSKKYCFMEQGTRRTEPVLEDLSHMLGVSRDKQFCDDCVMYAFDTLWAMGYEPHIAYRQAVWQATRPADKVLSWYISRLESDCNIDINLEDKAKIEDYLNNRTKDGKISESINTTMVSMFWEV